MKVFVTGGSGFLGRNFIKYVSEKGVDVCALTRYDWSESFVTQLVMFQISRSGKHSHKCWLVNA
jgi:nucleoside-diphosphate-sugar epimerase